MLCDHGGLHPVITKKGKYIPGNVYNQMKEIFLGLEIKEAGGNLF